MRKRRRYISGSGRPNRRATHYIPTRSLQRERAAVYRTPPKGHSFFREYGWLEGRWTRGKRRLNHRL
jgi:hypothetical protein